MTFGAYILVIFNGRDSEGSLLWVKVKDGHRHTNSLSTLNIKYKYNLFTIVYVSSKTIVRGLGRLIVLMIYSVLIVLIRKKEYTRHRTRIWRKRMSVRIRSVIRHYSP